VEDTWARRVRWITTTLIPDFPSPKLRDLPKVLTPKGIKWAKSYWLKDPGPLEWAHRPWDDWINPKLARYENRDTRTLEGLASSTPPDVESVTLPDEAWYLWQRVVLKPDCRKAEAVFRMKCLVLAGLLPEDFIEKDLRAFVEEEEEEPHWHKGVQRNLYRIIEDSGAWVQWKAKAPDPEAQRHKELLQAIQAQKKSPQKRTGYNPRTKKEMDAQRKAGAIKLKAWKDLNLAVAEPQEDGAFIFCKKLSDGKGIPYTLLMVNEINTCDPKGGRRDRKGDGNAPWRLLHKMAGIATETEEGWKSFFDAEDFEAVRSSAKVLREAFKVLFPSAQGNPITVLKKDYSFICRVGLFKVATRDILDRGLDSGIAPEVLNQEEEEEEGEEEDPWSIKSLPAEEW